LRKFRNGQRVLSEDLPCGEGIGKRWRWVEEYKIWTSDYDQTFWIDIPAGRHRIFVDNEGKDSVDITQ
jgi:hypothetical protein